MCGDKSIMGELLRCCEAWNRFLDSLCFSTGLQHYKFGEGIWQRDVFLEVTTLVCVALLIHCYYQVTGT